MSKSFQDFLYYLRAILNQCVENIKKKVYVTSGLIIVLSQFLANHIFILHQRTKYFRIVMLPKLFCNINVICIT